MAERLNPLRRLELPRRWEFLEEKAKQAEVDPSEIVERVDDAAKRVDALLRRVRDGGGGVIEVFYGLSGSGKTTFLRTLPRFFESIRIAVFPKEEPLPSLLAFVQGQHIANGGTGLIILIDRRDNPTNNELSQVEEMFADLLNVFREPKGAAVVLWPITKLESAQHVARTAWIVGRDSMADADSNGQFHFRGVDKSRYWELADNNSRTLTGDGLEAFGVTQGNALEFMPSCDTISDFFAKVSKLADEQRSGTWSVL